MPPETGDEMLNLSQSQQRIVDAFRVGSTNDYPIADVRKICHDPVVLSLPQLRSVVHITTLRLPIIHRIYQVSFAIVELFL
jgi:hypothetical protein